MRTSTVDFKIDTLLTEERDLFHELSLTKLGSSIESESPRIQKVRNTFISWYKGYSLVSPRFRYHSVCVFELNFSEIIYTKR
jgi:hypothetical protein